MAKDFAPGLPKKDRIGTLPDLPVDSIITMVRQRHDARRAGLHEDLRLGTPSGMYSWALPKFLPEEVGTYRLAIQQPIHRWSYNDFEGKLPPGYGEGEVSKIEKSPVVVLRREPNLIEFTRGTAQDKNVYRLFRVGKKWLATIKKPEQPTTVQDYEKEHFKSVPIAEVPDMIDNGASVAAKIDGAGALAYLGKKGINVYGIRTGADGMKPEYTDYIGGLRSVPIPEDLQGTMLRGEVYGVRNGQVVPPQELSGMLNSSLLNAVDKRQKGLRILMAALAVAEDRDVYDADRVAAIVNRLPTQSIKALPMKSGPAAKRLLNSIVAGKEPLTEEGVVVHQPGKRPVKAKVLEDSDVIVNSIFPAETKSGVPRAGGFDYALPGKPGQAVGRVGTGFDHKLLRDMLANPDAYIGRTARIRSQGQYDTGAYRAPSFIAMKED